VLARAPPTDKAELLCLQARLWLARAQRLVAQEKKNLDAGALRAVQADATGAVQQCNEAALKEEAGTVRATALLLASRGVDDVAQKKGLLEESLEAKRQAPALADLAMLIEKHEQNPARALPLLDEALALDKDNASLQALRDRVARENAVDGTFRSARHTHFVVRFEGAASERLAYQALDVLEVAYFRVGQKLALYPKNPITVVILTGEQYKKATAAPDWSTGLFDGKIRIREGALAATEGTLTDTLVHEYVHACVFETIPKANLPTWFQEGLAQWFEGMRPNPRTMLAGKALPSLESLTSPFLSLGADDAGRAYAASHLLVNALVAQRSAFALTQLMTEMSNGATFNAAFHTVFAIDVARFYDGQRNSTL
jgi:Peptidase MA superfamily